MKATKESIIGVLCAIEERENLDMSGWQRSQDQKVAHFIARARPYPGVQARAERDTTGLPFSRVILSIDPETAFFDAKALVSQLKSGSPSIWVMDQNVEEGEIGFELVHTGSSEIQAILSRLSALLSRHTQLSNDCYE